MAAGHPSYPLKAGNDAGKDSSGGNDPQLLGLLAEFLQEEGYQVTTAPDGHRARAALEEEEFHLALFDLMLPGPSGLELLSLVKSRTPETEVVIFTGHADLESSLTALRLGAYDYLVKFGLRLEEVGAVVARALEKSRLAQDNRKLLAQLRQTQAELARQRAQESAQIRRIGESLAGPLTPGGPGPGSVKPHLGEPAPGYPGPGT